MPAGSEKPFTKEKRLSNAARKAEGEFKNNRAILEKDSNPLDILATIDKYGRAISDGSLAHEMRKTRKESEDGPKGIRKKTSVATTMKSSMEGVDDWEEVSQSKPVKGQVTPGVWITKGR